MTVVYGPQAFTVGANTDLDEFPSAGSPDFAYNAGSGSDLYVNAANDRVQSATTGVVLARCIAAGLPTGNQEVTATVYATASGGGENKGALCVRLATDGSENYYYARASEGNLTIFRGHNGTATQLATGSRVYSTGANTLRFKATGTNPVLLEAQINATAVVTYSDSDANRKTSGLPGLGVSQVTGNVAYVDDFEVDDLSIPVGQVVETDVSQAMTRKKHRTLGQPSETDSSQVLTPIQPAHVSRASETDLAQSVAWAPKHRMVNRVSSTHLAQSLTVQKRRLLTHPSETGLARALTVAPPPAVLEGIDLDVGTPGNPRYRTPWDTPHLWDLLYPDPSATEAVEELFVIRNPWGLWIFSELMPPQEVCDLGLVVEPTLRPPPEMSLRSEVATDDLLGSLSEGQRGTSSVAIDNRDNVWFARLAELAWLGMPAGRFALVRRLYSVPRLSGRIGAIRCQGDTVEIEYGYYAPPGER